MTPAPPFDCAVCSRRIGRRRVHFLLRGGRVICARCIDARDLYDDLDCTGTRAGLAAHLGLWPSSVNSVNASGGTT